MLDPEEVKNGDGAPIVDESRRNLFKLAVAGSVASLITLKQNDALAVILPPPPIIIPPSPPVVSWQESIPEYVYRPKQPVPDLNPPTQQVSNQSTGNPQLDECGRNPMQRFDEFYNTARDLCTNHQI